MGSVNINIVIPGNQPLNSLMIMAAPDTPPGAILCGARNISKFIANIIEPTVNRK
jgi:hypothetical protein